MTYTHDRWRGPDTAGRESRWASGYVIAVLRAIALHSGSSYNDPNSPLVQELQRILPHEAWGEDRGPFRETRQPWIFTRTAEFNETNSTATITALGKQLIEGTVTYDEVLIQGMMAFRDTEETPIFRIIAQAILSANGAALNVDQVKDGITQAGGNV